MVQSINTGFIEEWHWSWIIERMYDPSDCHSLQRIFQDAIRKHQSSIFYDMRINDKAKLSREEKLQLMANKDQKLFFSEFMKCVLDFQLAEHEKFLKKFRQIFKTIDNDNNGILNE